MHFKKRGTSNPQKGFEHERFGRDGLHVLCNAMCSATLELLRFIRLMVRGLPNQVFCFPETAIFVP